jgi:hypothetical protein
MHVTASARLIATPGKPVNPTWSGLFAGSMAGEGEIRIEVEDSEGRPIIGYSAEECGPVKGPISDKLVSWAGKKDLKELNGQLVKFKFILRNAQLFSYSIE